MDGGKKLCNKTVIMLCFAGSYEIYIIISITLCDIPWGNEKDLSHCLGRANYVELCYL